MKVNIGDRVRITYNGELSDILLVFDVRKGQVLLHRETSENSCGWFSLECVIEVIV